MTKLTVSNRTGAEVKGDALVLVSVQTEECAALAPGHGLGKETVAHLESALSTLKARGKSDEVIKLVSVPGVAAALVVVTGAGKVVEQGASLQAEAIRRAVGSATRQLGGLAKVAVVAPGESVAEAAATAEGALLGAYAIATAAAGPNSGPVKSITVVTPAAQDKDLRTAVKRAIALGQATAYARDLVNQAPNELFPETFAALVKARAAGSGVKVSILDEAGLTKGAFGGHLTVGSGSARGPRLVTLHYSPAKATKHVAFVGKGITFDSGGLTIKPKAGMATMKCDMAGAAAVASAVFAIAELGLPVEITAHLCLAENMPGSSACRPGDVVTMRGGKTVELNNTDAEGRMVLADGLALASEKKPDLIIDIATLTGAAVMALGNRTAAFMSNDDDLRMAVKDIADEAGEPFWPFPLLEDIRPTLDSSVADLLQSGPVGVIYAGWFLAEFVGNGKNGMPIPWAHLDIAGPAFNDEGPWGYTPKQGTGFGIRTLVGIAESQT
ncbi:MAG: leucyl aminopeptidase [Dermatophilaceae bacterium]|nr:leucyl aminopeptidase [Dermatophilaceae bacterium]